MVITQAFVVAGSNLVEVWSRDGVGVPSFENQSLPALNTRAVAGMICDLVATSDEDAAECHSSIADSCDNTTLSWDDSTRAFVQQKTVITTVLSLHPQTFLHNSCFAVDRFAPNTTALQQVVASDDMCDETCQTCKVQNMWCDLRPIADSVEGNNLCVASNPCVVKPASCNLSDHDSDGVSDVEDLCPLDAQNVVTDSGLCSRQEHSRRLAADFDSPMVTINYSMVGGLVSQNLSSLVSQLEEDALAQILALGWNDTTPATIVAEDREAEIEIEITMVVPAVTLGLNSTANSAVLAIEDLVQVIRGLRDQTVLPTTTNRINSALPTEPPMDEAVVAGLILLGVIALMGIVGGTWLAIKRRKWMMAHLNDEVVRKKILRRKGAKKLYQMTLRRKAGKHAVKKPGTRVSPAIRTKMSRRHVEPIQSRLPPELEPMETGIPPRANVVKLRKSYSDPPPRSPVRARAPRLTLAAKPSGSEFLSTPKDGSVDSIEDLGDSNPPLVSDGPSSMEEITQSNVADALDATEAALQYEDPMFRLRLGTDLGSTFGSSNSANSEELPSEDQSDPGDPANSSDMTLTDIAADEPL